MPTVISKFLVTAVILAAAAHQSQAQQDEKDSPASKTKVLAVVLGQEVAADEKERLSGLIFGQLLERFAKENKIEPSEKELDQFVVRLNEVRRQQSRKWRAERAKLRKELQDASLSDKERRSRKAFLSDLESILKEEESRPYLTPEQEEQNRRSQRETARMFVGSWKINQALFKKYGGRVIFQQAGPEPLDAYHKFLQEHEQKGSFKILDPEAAKSFWKYFVDENMHTFASAGSESGLINTPWWQKEPDSE